MSGRNEACAGIPGDAGLTGATRVQRSEALLATELNGEIVLLHVEAGKYFGLDAVAAEIWRHMEKPIRIDDLCAALEADFQGAPEVIRSDVQSFLQQLMGAGAAFVCPA